MLTGKQKRILRGLGHGLKPVVTVGKGDVTESLLEETNAALDHHELIKVKILESCSMERQQVAEEMATGCRCEVAQILGRTVLLYRQKKEPVIVLPKIGNN